MFRWIQTTSFLVTAIALFGFVAGPGCQPTKGKDPKVAKDKENKDKHDDHDEFGPHGGPLAEWPPYHAEFTSDPATKTVVVYVLDETTKKAADLEPSRISKVKLVIAAEKVDLDLTHDAKKSGSQGLAYTGTHDFFGKDANFSGNISMVVDEGKKGVEKRFTDELKYAPKKAEEKKK